VSAAVAKPAANISEAIAVSLRVRIMVSPLFSREKSFVNTVRNSDRLRHSAQPTCISKTTI
jgi:hypothetical protein